MKKTIAAVMMMFTTTFAFAQQVDFASGKWLDLSHEYSDETIYWPTSELFSKETVFEGHTPGGWYYTAYSVTTAEHGGTHIDAPIHFFEGAKTVDELDIEQLTGATVVIDIRSQVQENPDYQLSVADIHAWEEKHGKIEPHMIVLINTGFASRWPNAKAYLGTAGRGQEAVADLHFPGIHPDSARLLLARNIKAVGLDTASIDFGQSKDYMTHRILFEANVPGFENLASLDGLPARGAVVFALPMKIAGGSGAPLRVAAFVPHPE